ncbi:iron chelate uptake ABC transporter family permease subunit [Enterococcus dongliensis]|uniref:Iron chelate uptake ABC transporter family permease subunit n=1 Tax=Enterococcus dongliensis TaxID=2559925 RepID=A0AAP5KRA1_9ENTE|nr:iron chelate uptake ABC transporter family permease subunit [Enterococcus dongliensis]MDT2596434.1 iron chelate uptake ABC transporter family permease subunit [Enterococcus dongliensis]MDT2603720.1 iron chelate uptake ABC transporter family permease subunit [Enterococcus dongliensis]MDT2634125.1 iron chelate uptake ABC transporter family permease subunit [Enterococcus dongliensis]MDT2637055.1 iron chelate uptake ABC transporter family permease subunit [Enterococcus dongliensis]MDT2640263.1 
MRKRGIFFTLFLLSALSLFIGVKDLMLQALLQGDAQQWLILLTTRLPRTISLILAGATMSICGLIMQHLTQNKFVSPTTAGTMDSARLGILLVMLFLPNASTTVRTFSAFVFAFLGTMVFLGLSRLLPTKDPIFLPLLGVMFGNIVGSVATFFAYQFQLIQNMSSWLQGNFSLVTKGSYELLYLTIPLFFIIYFFAYFFTIVGLGEDVAISLGIHYQLTQLAGIGLVAAASGLVLIMVGSVPFLGVIVPNIVSLIYGDHVKQNLWITALSGSLFLMTCDILSRVVIAPYEVPVSLTVGILGSLIFIYLLVRRKQG